jgi:hypothetical protein
MALWGNSDAKFAGGTVSLNYTTLVVTGSGTSFGAVGAAATGDVIRFGVNVGTGTYFGDAVITGITSAGELSIGSTAGLSGVAIAGTSFQISQLPKYTVLDSKYSEASWGVANNDVYGVDEYEASTAVTTQYAVTHAGWVGVHTYVDQHGNLRVKSETLVAMSGITSEAAGGDANDDSVFVDQVITISAQPSNVGIGTTQLPYDAAFSVTASATPGATLAYAWQYASSVGAAYTALSDDATYSGTTTAGLGVTATDQSLDGYAYRVVVTTTGGATATSDAGVLTITA